VNPPNVGYAYKLWLRANAHGNEGFRNQTSSTIIIVAHCLLVKLEASSHATVFYRVNIQPMFPWRSHYYARHIHRQFSDALLGPTRRPAHCNSRPTLIQTDKSYWFRTLGNYCGQPRILDRQKFGDTYCLWHNYFNLNNRQCVPQTSDVSIIEDGPGLRHAIFIADSARSYFSR